VTAIKAFEISRNKINKEIYNTFWTKILEKGFRKVYKENNFAL